MTRNEENLTNVEEVSLTDEIEETPAEVNPLIRGWVVKWEDHEPRYLHDETSVRMDTITRLGNNTYLLTIPHEQQANEFFIWHDDREQATLISHSLIKDGTGWTLNLLVPSGMMSTKFRNDPYPLLEHLIKAIKKVNDANWDAFIPKERDLKPHDNKKDHETCIKILLEKMGQSAALLESSISVVHSEDARLLLLHDDQKTMLDISHALLIMIPVSERKRFTYAGGIRRLPSNLLKKKFKVTCLVSSEPNIDLQTYVKLLEEDSRQSTFVLDLKQQLAGGVVFLIKPIPWLENLSYQLSTALKLGEERRALDLLTAMDELDEIVQLEQRLTQLPYTKDTIQQCFNAAIIAEKHDAKHLAKTFMAHGIKIACSWLDFTETFNIVNMFITQFKDDESREEILATFRKDLNVVAFQNSISVFHANWIRWFHQLYSDAHQNNAFRTKRELTRLWMRLQEHITLTEERILPLVIEVLNGFYLAKEDVDKIIFDLIANVNTPLDLRIRMMRESIERGLIEEDKMMKDPLGCLDDYLKRVDKFFKILTVTWLSLPWTNPIEVLLVPSIKKIKKRDDLPLYLKDILAFLHDVLSVQTFEPKRIQHVLSDIYKPLSVNNKTLMNKIQETVLLIAHDPTKYFDESVRHLIATVEREHHLFQAKKSKQPASKLEHLKEAFKAALLTPDTADDQQIVSMLLQEKFSAPRLLELGTFLINEIKSLGIDAALHLTTTLQIYTSILEKALQLSDEYRNLLSWVEEAIEFTRFFKFKAEKQQNLLITLIEECLRLVKRLPKEQQPSLIMKLLIPWSKIIDTRTCCQMYKNLFTFIKKQKNITVFEDFFCETRKVLEAAKKQPRNIDDIDSEKLRQKITKLENDARTWKQHEKEKKMLSTAEACINSACKLNDLTILHLVVNSLCSQSST